MALSSLFLRHVNAFKATGITRSEAQRAPSKRVPITSRMRVISIPTSSSRIVRLYAIRDRYLFPLSEQEKMALQLEKEAAEKKKVLEEHKAVRKALKSEIRYRAPKPHIEKPGEDIIYPEFVPAVQPQNPRSVNIAVIGPANAGKSTWTNRMCGVRVTPVSSKPQTTREKMVGVATQDNVQMVIFDTPGLIADRDRKKMGRHLTKSAWGALDEADVALVFMDSVKTIDLTARDMLKNLEKYMKTREEEFKEDPDEALKPLKAILFLNKHDKYLEGRFRQKDEEKNPFPVQDRFRHHFPQLDDVFDKVLHGSALTGDGMQELTDQLKRYAEEREWYYAKETKTDKSQLDQAFEVIREKLFRHLNQELPYLVVQENIGWTEDKLRGILTIQEKFYIPKESQRAILHGHMKGIIFEAERDLTSLFGIKVQLRVHVVVRKERVEPALSDAMVDFDIL